MKKRVTIYDVAEKLGISVATVNRALNDKPRVKPETSELVKRTAAEMGFKPNALAQSLSRRQLRLGVLAFSSFPEFHDRFIDGARRSGEELRDFNVSVDYFAYSGGMTDAPEAEQYLSERLRYFADAKYDGVLVLARQTPDFELLAKNRVYLATAVNDVDPSLRQFHICYNGFAAGRIAAELIYRMMPDRRRPVAIASGAMGWGIHTSIIEGFRDQIQRNPLELFRICYNNDNTDVAYESTLRLLRDCPDLGAIYVNSFNSIGVIRAVEHEKRIGDILLVTSDIYDELRDYIRKGAVMASIFQNQFEQGRRGLNMLYHALTDRQNREESVMIDPQIILSSNMALFE